MARSTARTGKLKRAKARKADPDPQTRDATVGELLAALHDEAAGGETEATTPPAALDDPDDLGLAGYEDRPEDLLPVLTAPEPAPEPRADGVELSDTLPMAPEDDLSRVKGKASPRLMSVVESLLFASDRPLTVRDIRRVLKEPTVRQVQLALKHLQSVTAARGVVLSQVAGGFRLRTNPNNARWVQKMLAGKPARLSRSQLEALAVVAYRQPITKAEIDHVRGVDCGAVLRVLLERDLVRIVGRKEEPGRPHLYGTTVEFLEFFNLRSLRDMPDLHEFSELTDESRSTLRAELGEDADEVEAEVLGQEVLQFDGDRESDEGAGATEDADASGEAEAADGAESSEGAEVADGAEASAEAEAADGAEPSEVAEAADGAEPSEVAEAADGTEAREDAEASEVADASGAEPSPSEAVSEDDGVDAEPDDSDAGEGTDAEADLDDAGADVATEADVDGEPDADAEPEPAPPEETEP